MHSSNQDLIAPMDISHSMKSIFIVNRSLINSHLSDDVEMADVKEIKLRDIYNNAEDGKIIINRNMKDEQEFPYSFRGIYRTESSAKLGAAEVNRSENAKIDKVINELMDTVNKLEKIQKSFEELKKVNLI
jgi:hypothetical protein